MSVTIRDATAADVAAIAATHVQADDETYRPIFGERFRIRTLAESEARWRNALAAGDVLLVAEEGGQVVGLAHAHGAWMSALYLLASHHRRGIGAALLGALCRAVQARGIAQIQFDCVDGNLRAIAFYEAIGAHGIGRQSNGEGALAWEEIVFALATDVPAALRRG